MPDPIEYLIVRDLQTALGAMTVVGGYHYDVAGTAVKLDPNHAVEDLIAPDGPRPFILIELKPERWEYFPAGGVNLAWPITVHWVGTSDPTDDTSRLYAFLCGCADVERAIAQDISRGGRAVDTRIVKRTNDDGQDGAQVWAVIDLEIQTERTFGQPDAA